MFRPAVLTMFLALSLFGCGGDEKDSGFLENAQQTATDTATHPGSPGGAAVIPSTESGTTVLVTLNDNSIAVADADRIPPGPTVFTITNGGVFGSMLSTPILNYPQVGILGLHGITDRPVAINGQVVIRPWMYTALTYDHRIVDGREAVQFLVKIKQLIEVPETLLIEG